MHGKIGMAVKWVLSRTTFYVLLLVGLFACNSNGESTDEIIDESNIGGNDEFNETVPTDETIGESNIETELFDDQKEKEWDKKKWNDGKWNKDSDKQVSSDGVLEETIRLVEQSGGEVVHIDHPERDERSVLAVPQQHEDQGDIVTYEEIPLIVSLHGFGGNSADHATYIPFHERVNSERFALLLPNGIFNEEGSRFWNPTDRCCEGGKSGDDDVAFLTWLVAEARNVLDIGPVYFFGYSNGGFMAHHMACKGLPGLRAVASLAGTSYVDGSSCESAPPVSVLHIHGTADSVIFFEGDEGMTVSSGEAPFYLGAQDMVQRWSRKIGCEWPENPQPYSMFDLDRNIPGSETQAFRLETDCTDEVDVGEVNVELWRSEGSSHAPAYDHTFVDTLLAWLLVQRQ